MELYGAPWLQPVASGGKSSDRGSGRNKPNPLPPAATGCGAKYMVRRGSTVRVRQGALQSACCCISARVPARLQTARAAPQMDPAADRRGVPPEVPVRLNSDVVRLRPVESSDLRYAHSGDVHVAYRVFGGGPPDLVFAMGMDFPSVEFHDHADGSDFHELTDRMRVIRFDKRGTGASDRVTGAPSLEERMDDVRAVMDAVGAERAALLGHVDGAAMAILFAATYPERVFALTLFQGKPRFVRAPDFPWAPTRDQYELGTQSWLAELQGSADLERAFANRLGRSPSDPVVRERARATRL